MKTPASHARHARVRAPHTLTIHLVKPPVTLRFWTVQALELASQAAEAQAEGDSENAQRLWSLARDTAPADDFTRNHCAERAKETA